MMKAYRKRTKLLKFLDNLSLKNYLVLILAVQLVVAVSVTTLFSSINTRKAIDALTARLQEETIQRVYFRIREILQVPQDIVKNIIAVENAGFATFSDLDAWANYFWHQIQDRPILTGMGLATNDRDYITLLKSKDGGLVLKKCNAATGYDLLSYRADKKPSADDKPFGRIADYDGRKRPQYKAGAEAGQPRWSKLSSHLASASLFTTFSHPVFDNHGELKVVVFGILFTKHFGEYLEKQKIGKTGQIFVIDESGHLIATSTGEAPFKIQDKKASLISGHDSSNDLTRAAYREISERNIVDITVQNQAFFEYNNQKHFLSVHPLKDEHGLNWKIVVTIPQNDYMEAINASNRITIMMIVLFLFLSILMAIFSAHRLTRPLDELRRSARAIAEGDWNTPLALNQKNEIGDLSQAFNSMAGQLSKLIGNLERQIAERKQAEAALSRLRNYLSNIIDSMPSALVGVDVDGQVTQWNRTMAQVTGIDASSARGKPLTQLLPWMAAEKKRIVESIRSKRVIHDRRQTKIQTEGLRYEDVTIYPLMTNGVEGAVIRVDDVTEKVRMEEMMIQSEKMLSVGGLAAGMAHEINNPLAGMLQSANVMGNRLTNSDLPANIKAAEDAGTTMSAITAFMTARGIPSMLENIRESGRRTAEIVANMLRFARKSETTASSYDLAKLIDQTVDLAGSDYNLKKRYDFRQITVVKEYAPDLPPVPCEAAMVQQVLLNLLRNSAEAIQEKWSPSSSDKPLEQPRIILRLAIEPEIGMARIEVEDNGPGIDSATLKRIFEPFFTTKPVDQGTGLGLSVSYFIITENHGGELKATSTPGEGSCFVIKLPLAQKMNRSLNLAR